jgi:hypothetical protein
MEFSDSHSVSRRSSRKLVDVGGRFLDPKGHSFACEGEAAESAVLENRSHAVGQSSDKRTLLRVGRGQPVGLYAPLHWRGCCAACPSTARLLWVGSHRCPLLLSVSKLSAFIDAFRSRPPNLHSLASLKDGARWGLAMCVLPKQHCNRLGIM